VRTRFLNLRTLTGDNTTAMREIVVENGRFADLLPPEHETAVGGEEWINLGGALVLPGAIDGHVHFDDPGYTHREDFASGTAAAAAGGVTCVVDMPCTSLPPVTDVASLERKLRVIRGKAHVDYMLWGGASGLTMASDDWHERLSDLVDAGIAAVKIYMLSGMPAFPELDSRQIAQLLGQTRRLGIPVGVHAEDATSVRVLTDRIRKRDGDSPAEYAASRPVAAEVAAVARMIETVRTAGARVHIVHVAAGEAVDLVSAARLEGLAVSAETCPHFLEFTLTDFQRLGSLLKTAPVVKSEQDRDRLWQGLANRELSFVTTDHAPGQWPEEKKTGSIWSDYGGVPGVELMVPYLFSEGVCKGRITLERMTEITASEPARFFGIDHRKGAIARGFDADFIVLDDHETWTVRARNLHNLNRYTPLEGYRLTGRIRATYLRGTCVYQRRPDGTEFFAPPGIGAFVKRGLA
jgi:allantoinase